jgi:hypothetical protein
MEAKLHQWYTVDDAIAAFGGHGDLTFECDRQFVVLPKFVLCFLTIGNGDAETHVCCPSCVVWKPGRLDYSPADEYSWLPKDVREVWDRSGKEVTKIRDHRMFVRQRTDDKYFFAGDAHLGSVGGPTDGEGSTADRDARFSLTEKLPRDLWLHLGGYRGWQVEVNHQVNRIDSGDTQAFRALVEKMPLQEFSHLCMTRYEEDSLTLHTNARRGWLMYLRDPADGGLYTRDDKYKGPSDQWEMFRCVCGIDLEFLTCKTLPRDLAIRVAEEFSRLADCLISCRGLKVLTSGVGQDRGAQGGEYFGGG